MAVPTLLIGDLLGGVIYNTGSCDKEAVTRAHRNRDVIERNGA
jgi:hypothetical protein